MKLIEKMVGYKATNSDMTCQGHAFELGKWYEHPGEVELCKSGFHFCAHPSGPSCYYGQYTMRLFKCEAEQILECPTEAGADFKLVAKRIRLTEEITPGMNQSKGSNTGDSNTGVGNVGDWNVGDRNVGDWNVGYRNVGYSNVGNRNTGDWNVGDRNVGYRNVGYSNVGNRNTGDRNTGNWNATNLSSGMFCQVEPKIVSFDKQTKLTHEQFFEKYPESGELGELLHKPEAIDFAKFKRIPGITKKKLETLHAKHLAAKKK